MGLEPGTTKADVRTCLENWNKGDNGILDLSKAYRLKRGTGWLIPAGRAARPRLAVHLRAAVGLATCSACTSRWSKAAKCPGRCWSRTCPKDKHQDLDFIIEQLDWEKNVDPHFKEHNYLEPIVDKARSGPGYTDRWIVYGTVRRRAAVQRQGTDRRAGREVHAEGPRRQRLDHRAGQRPHRQAATCRRRR